MRRLGPAMLFCPGNRPDRFEKAALRSDTVILDLEDAVGADDKDLARDSVARSGLDPDRTVVRVNAADTPEFGADIAMVRRTAYRTVMLPKTESPKDLRRIGDLGVVALCETATGLTSLADISAAPNLVGMMWGAEDLARSLGGSSSRHDDGEYRDFARTARALVLFHARARGLEAVDSVYLDLRSPDGLRREAVDAVHSGFTAKAYIHPGQVDVVRQAFQPTAEQLDWADRVLTMAAVEQGVFSLDGVMVDEPVLWQARVIMARAQGAPGLARH